MSEPGKCGPKLYQDFLLFDPTLGRPNVLTEHSPPVGEGLQIAPAHSIYYHHVHGKQANKAGSCRHDYTTKVKQSVLPPLDLRPDGTSTYKLAVVCKDCRLHAEIRLDHSHATSQCPTAEHPLHHFQLAPLPSNTTADGRLRFEWRCSIQECAATLEICYRQARLTKDDIELLSNTDRLRRRYEAAKQDGPTRDGLLQATPMQAYHRLRRYIKDALDTSRPRSSFPANNKRFIEVFGVKGQDCRQLLERLGFQYGQAGDAEGMSWLLPNPAPVQDLLQADGSTQREQLDDVMVELLALMSKLAAQEGHINPDAAEQWSSANRDIERTLAAQGYSRHMQRSRASGSNAELLPCVTPLLSLTSLHPVKLTKSRFFNSLGSLPDFSDSLIEYAYDRQTICDPERSSYYFECLQVLSEDRGTEQLQMRVATLQSQDVLSRRDITAAYRHFDFSPANDKYISDSDIINKYQARQSDIGAVAQEEARGHLYRLGIVRNSSLLINASRQLVDTYDDALAWLGNGVNRDTSDDGIIAVVGLKTADNKANEEIAIKAVSTIARARKSDNLNHWLITGSPGEYTMTVDEALRTLNIEQKLAELDTAILPAYFDGARQDRPGDNTEKAISVIEKALSGGAEEHAPESWPVGLTSLGNTCYLNSLLQYYFCLEPFRNVVLQYDKYKLDTSKSTGKKERVGRLATTMLQIKGGQRFAQDLEKLFNTMIKSPNKTVKPDGDIVCRAFLKPEEYMLLDPVLRNEKAEDDNGPTLVDDKSALDEDMSDADPAINTDTTSKEDRKHSDASSVTMVNGDETDMPKPPPGHAPPTPPGTPGTDDKNKEVDTPSPSKKLRRHSTTKADALELAQKKAMQQQDVAEAHDLILNLLRSGMIANGEDAEGEQQDALRSLFAMRYDETTIEDGKVKHPPKPCDDSNIQLAVPLENIDLYSALDKYFDIQARDGSPQVSAYKSITALPPFLQINIPRAYLAENNASRKSDKVVRLVDELYMDRYVDGSHEDVLARRQQCWGWRKELRELGREQKHLANTPADINGPTAIAQVAEYLTSLDDVNSSLQSVGVDQIEADGDITSALTTEAQQQSQRLAEIETQIDTLQKQADAQFTNMKKLKYHLAAVFFHRGSAVGGHYWIYIRDFKANIWRSYNDETVSQFNKPEEIYQQVQWDQGTPTYAVYVADEHLPLVQPVCRKPEKEPTPEPSLVPVNGGDVEMGNAESQRDSFSTIDPKLTVTESNNPSWDQPRQVVNGGWHGGIIRSYTSARLVFDSWYAKHLQNREYQKKWYERSPSPKRRYSDMKSSGHDSACPSPTKQQRLRLPSPAPTGDMADLVISDDKDRKKVQWEN